MQQWIDDEVLKAWLDAQRQWWQPWPLAGGAGLEAWNRQLEAWERTVREALGQQSEWLEQWLGSESGSPDWSRQAEQGLRQWLTAQQQLWDGLLTALRGAAPAEAVQAVAEAVVALEPAAAVQPLAAEPVIEATAAVAERAEPVIETAEAVVEPAEAAVEAALAEAEPAPEADAEPSAGRSRRRANRPD